MPLNIRLETTAPGQGLFRIAGFQAPGDDQELAIQRNLDDRYLGEGQAWQVTPHWHRLPGVVAGDGELSVHAGPQIIDPVAAASHMALRVLVRRGAAEESGVLRITGHLLGSPAARGTGNSDPLLAEVTEPDLELDLELFGERREPPPEPPTPSRRVVGPLAALLLLVLIVGAGIGVWQLGWLDRWIVRETPPESLVEPVPDQVAAETGLTPETAAREPPAPPRAESSAVGAKSVPSAGDEPEVLRGIELARAFLAANPTPEEIQAQAERREQVTDCDAAMVLYNRAAQADPRLAASLANRLDPQGFAAGGCIQAPDTTAASLWYREAADAGDPAAQRRLGQLLIASESSGPLFEDGVRLLRRAAQSGDREAKDLLVRLGKL